MNLRAKFSIFYFLGIFTPILLVSFIAYYVASNEVKREAFYNLSEERKEAEHEVNYTLASIKKDFEQFLGTITKRDSQFVISKLKLYASTLGEKFAYMKVFRGEGPSYTIERRFGHLNPEIFVTYQKEPLGKDTLQKILPDIGGYTLGMKGRIDVMGQTIVMRLKLPILLQSVLEKYSIRNQRFIYAALNDGIIVYHPDLKYIGLRVNGPISRGHLVSFGSSNDWGISLTSVEDPSPILAPFKRALRITLFFTFLVLLLSLFLSYRILGDVIETVKSLAFESKNLAEGKLVKPIFQKRRDELGDIARHINQIAMEIYDSAQIRAFHKISLFLTHDLKNILTEMSLLLRNLEVHYEKPGFKEDAIFTLKSSVEEMSKLVHSLRPKKKEIESLNLKDLIDEALFRLSVKERKDIDLELDLKEAKIEADRGETLSVFTNIISNAIDAMKEGGKLTIKMDFEDPWIVIKIRDTGVGMTKEFIETKLFRPFSTTKENGLGLGLFQVKDILKTMGGEIKIDTSPGKGTLVTLYIKR